VETPANVVAEHEAEAVTVEEVAPPSAFEPVDVVTTSEDTETLAVEETVPAVDVSAPTSEEEVSATIDITETK
jgi:hypothetical protein